MLSYYILTLGIFHILASTLVVVKVEPFAPDLPILQPAGRITPIHAWQRRSALFSTQNGNNVDVEKWNCLTEDGGVKMRLIPGPLSSEGAPSPSITGKDDVTVEYVGSLAERVWSVEDTVACWLPDQGLDSLAPELFRSFNINGTRLTDAGFFTKKFVLEGLGVRNKIDKLVGAAQELKRHERTHPPGTVFDKNRFTFRLGKRQAIQAFELALNEMRPGDSASLLVRSDYAYGKGGVRSAGKFLVPPYATVSFDLIFVEIK